MNKIIKLNEDIVASNSEKIRKQFQSLLETEDIDELILDFADVKMIDSLGIGVIIATHNSINTKEGVLSIINADENIYKLFKTMRLNTHFSVNGELSR
jgi:anti-anti-sigma factor